MTLREAKEQGYTEGDMKFFRGYVSRKGSYSDDEIEVHVAGGHRKGQLYIELPCWISSYYSYRLYLVKEAPRS